MALFHFSAPTGAATDLASEILTILGPIKSEADLFDAGQPSAFSVACAVVGLIIAAPIVESLRRSR